jgi:hypothetical protein
VRNGSGGFHRAEAEFCQRERSHDLLVASAHKEKDTT